MGSSEQREINGKTKSIRELLGGVKYSIDLYQREYMWQEKHMSELISDLVDCFLDNYDESHQPKQIASYSCYFLGSIIISQKSGDNYIIDGQQRLTSLTLLLIYLNNLQAGRKHIVKVDELIYSEKYQEKSFNICVEDRVDCMKALFEDNEFEPENPSESAINIIARYQDIEESFPEELKGDALLFFIDWLIEKVHLVEIVAYKDEDAYRIFETMNDRGLSLTPTEMLKGYLLANIRDSGEKNRCNEIWRNNIEQLNRFGKEEDADCIKAWLRSQYAESIRERKRGSTPKDFDRIGTEFHRWIRDKEEEIGLKSPSAFASFIKEDFAFFAKWYKRIRSASVKLEEGLEHIFYNAQTGFTLQYSALLAPLTKEDSEDVILKKIRAVAIYLDIFLNRRIWNYKQIGYSGLSYTMYLLMLQVRRKPLEELSEILYHKLEEEPMSFANSERPYRLHGQNRKYVRLILARMTHFVSEKAEVESDYQNIIQAKGMKQYEVEHIWANHFERHQEEFDNIHDFSDHRNMIGGLLLLPKQFNASYNDKTYEQKSPHYFGQNILAQTLCEKAYEHNPAFLRFVRESGLNFKPYSSFSKEDLSERQALCEQLAETLWSPEQLRGEVTG